MLSRRGEIQCTVPCLPAAQLAQGSARRHLRCFRGDCCCLLHLPYELCSSYTRWEFETARRILCKVFRGPLPVFRSIQVPKYGSIKTMFNEVSFRNSAERNLAKQLIDFISIFCQPRLCRGQKLLAIHGAKRLQES